ncbi:hypothetical protein BN1012_Phect2597 [Candidatus Phaeomarinobacter ectocarpi]|uniref:Uncharacterized protein n=1 Tax=Candidatus Phaeomarinibacter ectocarpi TaxID=1458461 RepID=X5MMY5_9HYPH|nr:hypothetical protein [Candidatus Phaeomarinobacter ectocarpi]CDO60810.1 hypothetical protein BN1012_Phect2597 [Candidatus Phaeomarinobacter ectocarpi]
MIKTPSLSLVQQLLDDGVDALKDVGLMADLAAADESTLRSPSAFVLPAGGDFLNNKTPGRVAQTEASGFAVLLAFKDTSRSGEAGIKDFEPVRDAVLQVLMGAMLEGAQSSIAIKRQRLVDFDRKKRRLWWQITCTFNHLHRPTD